MTDLLAETFPEIEADRKESVDKALEIMKKESKVVYTARPLDEQKSEGWMKNAQRTLRSNRMKAGSRRA